MGKAGGRFAVLAGPAGAPPRAGAIVNGDAVLRCGQFCTFTTSCGGAGKLADCSFGGRRHTTCDSREWAVRICDNMRHKVRRDVRQSRVMSNNPKWLRCTICACTVVIGLQRLGVRRSDAMSWAAALSRRGQVVRPKTRCGACNADSDSLQAPLQERSCASSVVTPGRLLPLR
jgi:hypothetical protein